MAVGALLLLVALSISCSSAPELRGGAADSKAEVAATPPLATSPDSVLCPECEPVDVVEVIDANTVRTSIGDIQMYGAYVVDQPADCAALAKERLTAMAGGAIRIEPGPTDTVRNNSAHYYLFTGDGRSIEEHLVREGLALIWTQDGEHMDGFVLGDARARDAEAGCLWQGYKAFLSGEPGDFRVPGLTYPEPR